MMYQMQLIDNQFKKLKLTQKNINMKAYEFPAKVTAEGKLKLPDAMLKNSK